MSKNTYKKRTKSLYNPNSKDVFRLSRSKIEDFVRCPRCFYLDRRLGIKKPETPGFPLNIAVDFLLKKEFDHYRKLKSPHPIMVKNKINAIPFEHKDLECWRNSFDGIKFLHRPTKFLIFGGVDDIWLNKNGELNIVDYKATSKNEGVSLESSSWKDSYMRQMDIYSWILKKMGQKISSTSYFLWCNGKKKVDFFEERLEFDITIEPYMTNDGWVEPAIIEAYKCLQETKIPEGNKDCQYCLYRKAAQEIEK